MKTKYIRGNSILAKKQKNRKKVIRKLLLWLKLILTIFIITAILYLTASSPIFNIKEVEITGSSHYNKDTLISISGVVIGDNGFKAVGSGLDKIFSLRYGQAEKEILNNCPYVKSVKVSYKLPDTVKIDISERSPSAAVPYLGIYLLIDEEGYVLETVDKEESENLIKITGLKFQRYEVGKKLEVTEPEALEKVFKLLGSVKKSDKMDEEYNEDAAPLFGMISTVDVEDLKNISMVIDSRVSVNFGDLYDLDYKIRAAKQIVFKKLKEQDKGYLDFSTGDNPVFIPE